MVNDIEWINAHSPYPVKRENENLITITTDTGKVMGTGFRRLFTVGDHLFLYFCNVKLSGGRGGRPDLKLGATVSLIAKRYLMENPDNVLFFCHIDEPGSFAIERINLHWYDLFVKKHPEDAGTVMRLSAVGSDGKSYHAVFFISQLCTEREELIKSLTEQFDDFLTLFCQIKEHDEIRKPKEKGV